jgi:hypothetical protein
MVMLLVDQVPLAIMPFLDLVHVFQFEQSLALGHTREFICVVRALAPLPFFAPTLTTFKIVNM